MDYPKIKLLPLSQTPSNENEKHCWCELLSMEQHPLKSVNKCLNINIYSYLETSSGQSSILYLNVVHLFQHWC